MSSQLSNFVNISPIPEESIVVFDKIRIDGKKMFDDNTTIACFSHFHKDHMHGFGDSLGEIGTTTFTTKLRVLSRPTEFAPEGTTAGPTGALPEHAS